MSVASLEDLTPCCEMNFYVLLISPLFWEGEPNYVLLALRDIVLQYRKKIRKVQIYSNTLLLQINIL